MVDKNITINIDVDEIVKEVEQKAINEFRKRMYEECTGAIRNAASQLDFPRNFKYAWAKCGKPETKDDIAAIIFEWVTSVFAKETREYLRKHKDIKSVVDEFVSNDDFAKILADKLSRKHGYAERVAHKIAIMQEEED